MTTTSEWKCNRDRYCKTLAGFIQGAGASKGLVEFVLLDEKTGTQRAVGVQYKKSDSRTPILLNYCPWCGMRIDWFVQERDSKATGETP